MSYRRILPIVLLAVTAVAGISGYSFLRAWTDTSSAEVQAFGGKWRAENIEWSELLGAWKVSADMHPVRVQFEKATGQDLLRSFCGAVLTELPTAPREVERIDVFRVEIQAYLKPDHVDGVFKDRIPVAVDNGACQILPDFGQYFPRYPKQLSGWYLNKVTVFQGSETLRVEVNFMRNGAEKDQVFDFAAACRAYFEDGAPSLDEAFAITKVSDIPDKFDVRISDTNQRGVSFLNYSTSTFFDFVSVNGACLPLDGEDT